MHFDDSAFGDEIAAAVAAAAAAAVAAAGAAAAVEPAFVVAFARVLPVSD